jgi:hypothetical protein
MLERGAPSTRQTTATGSWCSMAFWAASPAGSVAPFLRLLLAGSHSPWSAAPACRNARSSGDRSGR